MFTQRPDDKEEVIAARLTNYEAATKPLTDYFQRSGRLLRVNGDRPVHDVLDDLCIAIERTEKTKTAMRC
jgi:adenylate kinase